MLKSPLLRIIIALIFVGGCVYSLITGEHIGRGRSTPLEVRIWASIFIVVGIVVIMVTIHQMTNLCPSDNDEK